MAGATVSVVQNGQAVLKKGYGFASLNPRKPVDPDRSLFRIGSISKTFTWILVMKEVEAGRMRLDAPINLYLNEKVRLPGRAREPSHLAVRRDAAARDPRHDGVDRFPDRRASATCRAARSYLHGSSALGP